MEFVRIKSPRPAPTLPTEIVLVKAGKAEEDATAQPSCLAMASTRVLKEKKIKSQIWQVVYTEAWPRRTIFEQIGEEVGQPSYVDGSLVDLGIPLERFATAFSINGWRFTDQMFF